MRQFGRMRLISSAQRLPKELNTLAPEPLSDEFTEEYFLETLSRSRRSLKQLLLDQTRVLGLGNIYAVEALFLAGVNPMKPANNLSKPRARKLYQAIREVLQEAIDAGSTLADRSRGWQWQLLRDDRAVLARLRARGRAVRQMRDKDSDGGSGRADRPITVHAVNAASAE